MDIHVDRLSAVIESVATSEFYPNLLTWLEQFIAFDNAIIYAFEQGFPPRCLSKTENKNSDAINQIYQQGAYLQDPFYQALVGGADTDLFTLRELIPSGFYHTDYYLNFYRKTGWQDETGVLLKLSPKRQLGLFFGKENQPFFIQKQHWKSLKTALEIIRSVARLHDEMMQQTPAAEIVYLDTQARYALTPRECEVVELILQGKGSPQIAEKLFISTGTVKNHRKNIYQKLQIRSQAELFSLFMTVPTPVRYFA
ncbi:response regulator transcription factor [Photorhabdus luminescens]|uniref:response regulator transcription factor n=1 Tax=Photorhabdus luminescens TaxID=29488 RepID=UPI002240AD83|nr:response regulator transcription factor [Photorhabdus luminescens]MCW7762204.1 response regulator transcription factor [Photorhabdus luminescens subsp. venezuelensis]